MLARVDTLRVQQCVRHTACAAVRAVDGMRQGARYACNVGHGIRGRRAVALGCVPALRTADLLD